MSLLRIGFAFSLATLSLACEEKPPPQEDLAALRWEEKGRAPAPGPRFEDDDFEFEVQAPRPCHLEGPMAPQPPLKRISIPVEVRGRGKRKVPVSAMTFTLEDAEGHEFRPTLAGCQPSMKQVSLSNGESIEGEVAFDVPESASKLEMRFEPFLIGREKVTARVIVPAALD